ncbi:hypothetical protein AB0C02_27015 [Micromonospora sp. NPDC048999]|uniref:hypothetical protein n=1 Tax=Micromonospora sp. NPDC048999 TaxID=3155391 RepID=UPI003400A6BD
MADADLDLLAGDDEDSSAADAAFDPHTIRWLAASIAERHSSATTGPRTSATISSLRARAYASSR